MKRALLAGLLLCSCNGTSIHALSVSVSVAPDTLVLRVGETRALTAQGFDANHNQVPNLAFTWRSSNESVATVSSAGAVTGVASGEADIVATSADESATAHVTVRPDNTLAITVTGPGTVTSTPAGIECTAAGGAKCSAAFAGGSTVTLNAVAADGSFFSSWSGDCAASTSGTCAVSLTANKTAGAAFVAGAALTVSLSGPGTVVSTPEGINCSAATPATCAAIFKPGTTVTLQATPGASASFAGYTGAGCGTGASCSFVISVAQNVTATFHGLVQLSVVHNGPGTVTSNVGGINCGSGSGCTASLAAGTQVTLTATPAPHSAFVSWTGCTSSVNTCTVTLGADTQITANFVALVDLNLTITGPGSVSSSASNGADIACTTALSPCTAYFLPGTVVTLTATPGPQATFASWTGCTSGTNICSVTLSTSAAVTAAFTAPHVLTVSVTGNGVVHSNGTDIACDSAKSPCTQPLAAGTAVTLTASAGANAIFGSWTGCPSPSGNVCAFTLNADTSVSAAFTATHVLTVNVTGSGTVHSNGTDINCSSGPCLQTLPAGTSVTLTATAGGGSTFSAFSQDCSGATCSLSMTADHNVTATFTAATTTVVHTTTADFSSGNFAGLGSLVVSDGGGAVQLATGGAELLPGSKVNNLTGRQVNAAAAGWNGRFYVAGGFGPLPASQPTAAVRSAPFNADNTLGAWRDETGMPEAMRDQEMLAWSGRLYVAGGYNNGGASSHVYSTKVAADGTLAAWDTETALPDARNGVPLVGWGNRIYTVSGSLNAGNIDGVVRSAPLDSAGRLGAWRAETTLPGGTAWHAIAYNGRIYSLGGAGNANDVATIYSVDIGADGVLGTWRAETPYPVSRNDAGIAVWGGRIYAAGGRINGTSGPATGTIISSAIASDGTLGAWRTESAGVPNTLGFFQAAAWNGTLALVAGDNLGSAYAFPINASGALGASWTATQLPTERHGHDTFAFGGNLFAAGGLTGSTGTGTADTSVLSAPLAADGSVGTFAATTNPWFAGNGQRSPSAVINGHVYAFSNSGGPGTQAFGYSTLSSAGVGASWTSSAWPFGSTWIDGNDVVSIGMHLYVAGGEDFGCGVHAEVWQAAIADDGSVGTWTSATGLPAGRYEGGGAAWNGFVYHVGGRTTGCPNPPVPLSTTVYYAKAAEDGSLGAWSTATQSLPAAVQNVAGVQAWDGTLYVLGGTDANQNAALTTVYTAKINTDGSLQAWATGTALPAGRSTGYGNNFVTRWNGKLYVVGGFDYASPQGGRKTVWASGVTTPAPRGSYFNGMDFGADKTLQSVAWTASAGGTLAVSISAASSSGAFSSWTPITSGATLSLATVRYLRYRLDLSPDGAGATPVLYDLTATVGP